MHGLVNVTRHSTDIFMYLLPKLMMNCVVSHNRIKSLNFAIFRGENRGFRNSFWPCMISTALYRFSLSCHGHHRVVMVTNCVVTATFTFIFSCF